MSKSRKRKSKSSQKGFMARRESEKSSNPKGQSSKLETSKQLSQQLNSGIQYYQSGKLSEAEACFQEVLQWQPDNPDAWHLLGVIAFRQKQYTKAIERIERAIELKPDFPTFHNNIGNALKAKGKLEEAIASYRHALQLNPDYPDVHNNLGNALKEQGKLEEALISYHRALQLNPDYPEAHYNLGIALREQGKLEEAITSYQRALQLNPDYPDAHNDLGLSFQEQGTLEEAISSYQRAIQLNPDYPDAHNNLGIAFKEQGKLEEAISSYLRALQLKHNYYQAHNNLGNALKEQGKLEEAISSYLRALQLKPDYYQAHNNLGIALQEQGKLEEALASYQRALQLNPDYHQTHYNLGNALQEQGKLEEALSSYQRALQLNPDDLLVLQQYVWVRRLICDWDNLDPYEKSSIAGARSGKSTFPPFVMLAVTDDPVIQLAAARNYWTNNIGHSLPPLWNGQQYSHDKIRLAYLSADFHQHATAYLMAELFELHDRSRFELCAISFGPDRDGPMRQRLVRAFDRFIDVRHLSHLEAAQQIRYLEIDIAVDLKGHTEDSRPQILAHRPAPIQVNYLGYPGTIGADCIDYILVDPFIVPPDQQPHFTEKLVHLPESYQVNDRQRPIADSTPSREDCGLPPQGFVFCSFNNSYKLTPAVFDVWMRLLAAVPDSVLWLLGSNSSMEDNLRREVQARGVNPDRLIFAPKQNLPEHLARHRLADLFLDNWPCNAHTTTSDALWAGLPVLTCAGRSFASRVAGSLLHAIGLPELVTDTLQDYEALALKFATEPDRLRQIKQKLQRNRLTMPLFDGDRFRRHIEAAYTEMWSIWQRGEAPKAFAVTAQQASKFPTGSRTKSNHREPANQHDVLKQIDSAQIQKQLDLALEHYQSGKLAEAEACFQQVLQWQPDNPDAWHLLGVMAAQQKQYAKAIKWIKRAIELRPDFPNTYSDLGLTFQEQGKLEEAIAFYQRALKLNPDYHQVHNNLGNALQEQGKLEEATASYQHALQLNPDDLLALPQYIWVRRLTCNWDNLADYEKASIAAARSGKSTFPPFVMLAVTDDPVIQLAAARNYWTHNIGNLFSPLWTGQQYSHDKIRLAYLSADFHQHATAYLMAELFELHDRSRFELCAISFGPEDTSPMRQRLVRAFDRFIDVRHLSHLEAARQIRDLEIDIAVDLKGYTKDSRPQILAHRPAPHPSELSRISRHDGSGLHRLYSR